jgi:hypothetical protein
MTSIRLLMCIVLKVLNYYITLETLKNIRLLLLYLGFQAKRLLMRMKETLQYFGYSVKKILFFFPGSDQYRSNCRFGLNFRFTFLTKYPIFLLDIHPSLRLSLIILDKFIAETSANQCARSRNTLYFESLRDQQ